MSNKTRIKRKFTAGKPSIESLSNGEMCVVVPENVVYVKKDFENLITITTGGKQCILVSSFGTPLENGVALQAAYDDAKTKVATAGTITIVATPGTYKFPSVFYMDTQNINLVSLDGNRSVIFDIELNGADPYVSDGENSVTIRTPCLVIGANNVFVKGIEAGVGYSDFLAANTSSGNYTFPIFVEDFANVVVENCKGGNESFGGASDVYNGIYSNSSGTFNNCVGGDLSFGLNGIASGTFNNCVGGSLSFGGGGTASGTFNNCVGGVSSFGSGGIASGTFNNCVGGHFSFGHSGTLEGKLYYCRLTAGTFPTVSNGGKTVYCINGNNTTNNQ